VHRLPSTSFRTKQCWHFLELKQLKTWTTENSRLSATKLSQSLSCFFVIPATRETFSIPQSSPALPFKLHNLALPGNSLYWKPSKVVVKIFQNTSSSTAVGCRATIELNRTSGLLRLRPFLQTCPVLAIRRSSTLWAALTKFPRFFCLRWDPATCRLRLSKTLLGETQRFLSKIIPTFGAFIHYWVQRRRTNSIVVVVLHFFEAFRRQCSIRPSGPEPSAKYTTIMQCMFACFNIVRENSVAQKCLTDSKSNKSLRKPLLLLIERYIAMLCITIPVAFFLGQR